MSTLVEARNLPRHVGIVMDGNGRWAQQRGLARSAGHEAGSRSVRTVVRAARRLGISALTLFAFSEQNWARPGDEVGALMALLFDFLHSEREEILAHGIRLRAVGDTSRLPAPVRESLDELARASHHGGGMLLSLALSYGGQEEIANAARELARAVARGELSPESITPAMLSSRIPSVEPGPPDLLVRTGGELRISNFLLWGAAYSELHFSKALWPDFGAEDLYEAVAAYQSRERRFGLTTAQVRMTQPVRESEAETPARASSEARCIVAPSA